MRIEDAILKLLIGAIAGIATYVSIIERKKNKKIYRLEEKQEKFDQFYEILIAWLHVIHDKGGIKEYFERNEYKTVAIYGMKELGECLYDELKAANIDVKYVIDKNTQLFYDDVKIITPSEKIEKVDVIIVTAVYYYEEIKKQLKENVNCPIVSLYDVVYGG